MNDPLVMVKKATDGARFFSTMNLSMGYWQIKLHPESKKYTAFSFDKKSYHFHILPFELNISVSVLIHALDDSLRRDFKGFDNIQRQYPNNISYLGGILSNLAQDYEKI
ncbi:uncharacterized protein LOC126260403 [Schistocerca nitens]|uniref:uncharacterized protein LOC126260403 n=1 Tax=Schistocerca nitens TaxID=7011 RepID=UPI0021186BEC|nr:uncharacterized protein LOC126260403 [Schistocerca nitens]